MKKQIRKITYFLITLSLLMSSLFSFQITANNDTAILQVEPTALTYSYSFHQPIIEKVGCDNSYDRITIKDLPNTDTQGLPCLPVKPVTLLLPPNTKVKDITFQGGQRYLGNGYQIEQGGYSSSILKQDTLNTQRLKIHQLHEKEQSTHQTIEKIGVFSCRGYNLIVLNIHPIHYNTITDELSMYQDLTLTLHLEEETQESPLYRGLESDALFVSDLIDNPEVLPLYRPPPAPPEEDYDYLILTTDEFKPFFEPLRQMHNQQNLSTKIKTLSSSETLITAPLVRNFIRDEYINHSISYVLIGGDGNIIPTQAMYCSMDSYPGFVEAPSDLYLACLDGSYNSDGDAWWGEPTDGGDFPGSDGDVDLLPELFIGRATVGTIQEVQHFVSKTLSYTNSDDNYLNNVLMAGEYLGWGGDADYGDAFMDELIDGSSAHGYTTVGVPSPDFSISTLYDYETDYDEQVLWPKSEIIEKINNGVHMIHHIGHGWFNKTMKLFPEDIDNLTNTNLCFIYSQSCMAGGFDDPLGYDCIAEYLTVKTPYGAFAGIWNSRYGVGSDPDNISTDGASQRYHREFIDAIFGEDIIQIGPALIDSKLDNLYRINESFMRLCFFEANLFGDPALNFHMPASPDFAADVNDDCMVDMKDVGLVKYYYGYDPSIPEYARYDVSGDGEINLQDISLIKYYYGPCPDCQ